MKGKVERKETGITLVALVVTIVVLLILAGITLIYVFGDNGIIKLAQKAKDETENAIRNEQEDFEKMLNILKNEYGGESGNNEGGGSNTPNPPEEVPIENIKSDWATIEKIAKEIAKDSSITSDSAEAKVTVDGKSYTLKPGDMFEVEYNGETRRVRVLGFKHDDLVDTGAYGSELTATKAGISFEFYDDITSLPMSDASNSNSGGWAATQMRKELNGYTNNDEEQSGKIGGLGANLSNKDYIKQVKKKYIVDEAGSVATSNDFLWLLACSEMVPKNSSSDPKYAQAIAFEGDQYRYYQGVAEAYNVESESRARECSDDWWLRSICNDEIYGSFCTVMPNRCPHWGWSD